MCRSLLTTSEKKNDLDVLYLTYETVYFFGRGKKEAELV
jgi:hypothetical protein